MSPRPTAENELTREQILEAARERFAELGYRAVSMRGLAQALKCSHGAIYYHFKDKADLYYKVILHDFDRLQELLDRTVEGREPNLKLLHTVIMEYIRFGIERPQSYEMMFMINDKAIEQRYEPNQFKCYNRFSEVVQSCLHEENEHGARKAWMLFLAMHGFVAKYIHSACSFEEISEVSSAYADFILAGT